MIKRNSLVKLQVGRLVEATATLSLNQVGAKKVQLLPFHQFGENKYHLLGKTYSYENVKALHPEDLTDYQRIFLDVGIDCFF